MSQYCSRSEPPTTAEGQGLGQGRGAGQGPGVDQVTKAMAYARGLRCADDGWAAERSARRSPSPCEAPAQ